MVVSQAFQDYIEDFQVDEFGIVVLARHRSEDRFEIHSINYLPACSFCNLIVKCLKRCGRCRKSNYCSIECQKKDWQQHKRSCVPFA